MYLYNKYTTGNSHCHPWVYAHTQVNCRASRVLSTNSNPFHSYSYSDTASAPTYTSISIKCLPI